ncbi:AraC family transcriptional regulator [Gaetbulibacter sp. M240]|uniref:AraC family transcriptional regulator n=1 Tax=Gaetbulibacter sp. M240 TaxID=3126511 RepID=UPI00374E6C12
MNQLIICKDLRLFFGSYPRTITEHSHPVIQLIVAVEGCFLSKDDSGNWLSKNGLLIGPNHTHECDARDVPIISVDIDPESSLGEWVLTNQLKSQPILDYPHSDINPIDIKAFSDCVENQDWRALRSMIENTFFFRKSNIEIEKDERIRDVLNFISEHIHENITTERLMDVSHLSESRLIHLFKKEMGLPIRNYILWTRLQIVFESILRGESLTAASYEAGFSDQAHMTRTFTKMIGVPPSSVIKNSKFVQVSFPE